MDLTNQQHVREAAERYGTDGLLVILGTASIVDAANFAETVTDGDQSYTGPLARVSLRLPVYHMLDSHVKDALEPGAWSRRLADLERKLDVEGLADAVARMRCLHGKSVL